MISSTHNETCLHVKENKAKKYVSTVNCIQDWYTGTHEINNSAVS